MDINTRGFDCELEEDRDFFNEVGEYVADKIESSIEIPDGFDYNNIENMIYEVMEFIDNCNNHDGNISDELDDITERVNKFIQDRILDLFFEKEDEHNIDLEEVEDEVILDLSKMDDWENDLK